MNSNTSQTVGSFGIEGDAYLLATYDQYGPRTVQQKINFLELILGLSDYNIYAGPGEVTDEVRLAILEWQYLVDQNKIKPIYC